MAQNVRSYYPVQTLNLKRDGSAGAYTFVHGVQTASASVAINSEDVNEYGQITVYQIVEDTADITLEVERVLDGCTPIYLLATEGSTAASLTGRQDRKTIMALGIHDSSADFSTAANAVKMVEYSGLQVSSVSYSFTSDGAFTETVGFIGDYAKWSNGSTGAYGTLPTDPTNAGTDEPCALTACSGGVQFKENLVFSSGATWQTLLPSQIPGITAQGFNPTNAGNCPDVPIQSIEISVDLSRDDISVLGCRGNFARLAQFPVDVTVSITTLEQDGNCVDITEAGAINDGCLSENAPNQRFRLVTESGLILDAGDRLKLTDVSTTLGDTGGGNAETTWNFTGKSVLSAFHLINDPSNIPYTGTP